MEPIKMKYRDVTSFEFNQAIQKIMTANVDNKVACDLHRVKREIKKAQDGIRAKYKAEIAEVYGKKDASGKLLPAGDGNPNGFDYDETKKVEFFQAQEAFVDSEWTFSCEPISNELIKDIRLSGQDLEVLGDLYLDPKTQKDA